MASGGTDPACSEILPKHHCSLLCLLHGSLTCLSPNALALKPSNRRKWSPLALRMTVLPHSQAPVLSQAFPALNPNFQSPAASRLLCPPPPALAPVFPEISSDPGFQMQLRITWGVIKKAVSRALLLIFLELEVCMESTHQAWDQLPQTNEADSPSCFSPSTVHSLALFLSKHFFF